MRKKTFLTDIDDVVLDWTNHFIHWCSKGGLPSNPYADNFGFENRVAFKKAVREFNKTKNFAEFSPYGDVVKHITKLHKEFSFNFIGITSCLVDDRASTHRKMYNQRMANLDVVFGQGVFVDCICIPIDISKEAELSKFSATYYVDDMFYNCLAAKRHKHYVFHMINTYNKDSHDGRRGITPVTSWKEIFEKVVECEKTKTKLKKK